MKQIDMFVESVYSNASGNKKEIEELKAEMKSHLTEAIYELKIEGKTEQEAIGIAIERFGGEKEMRSVVGQLFKTQKLFAKWILYLAIGCLITTVVVFGTIWSIEEQNAHENSIIATNIFDVLGGKEAISHSMEEEIKDYIQGTDQISKVSIFSVKDAEKESENYSSIFEYVKNAKPNYQYQRAVWAPEWLLVDFFPYGNGNSKWYVDMETRHFSSFMTLVLFVGFAVYATLFTIWATINSYHHRRLNAIWILSFALLNVIGYLIYVFVGKRKVRDK
ncbi:permease prefix domain 1-containing protein [Virgibacillus halodenitrificans]|uniref:permease prefix domain 1-containing protein n=1 Tax=Virgibacillus halodenitrificans TaxID=1482 RepID=UPI0024BFA82C|nr:permease prefix domain 1-containing protein [Virgibacillus halodenitrificans]WHX28074.1 permease prefix domain 1-containing protein [Virgibacillus halodenitrificans]